MCVALEDDPLVGIVGRSDGAVDSAALEATVDDRGGRAVTGGRETVLEAEPSLLVVEGEADLAAVVRARADVPTLAVGSISGVETVEPAEAASALESALTGSAGVRRLPRLEVDVESRGGDLEAATGANEHTELERALFDVTLVAKKPAQISEFGVYSRDELVETVRADGIVTATPAGSHGYTTALGGPLLSVGVDGVAVTPIAPFVTRTPRWVVPSDDLVLSVERNEADVTLVVDGQDRETLTIGAKIRLSSAGRMPVVVPAPNCDSS